MYIDSIQKPHVNWRWIWYIPSTMIVPSVASNSARMVDILLLVAIRLLIYMIPRRLPALRKWMSVFLSIFVSLDLLFFVRVLRDESLVHGANQFIRSISFTYDGKYLATGAEDKQITVKKNTPCWMETNLLPLERSGTLKRNKSSVSWKAMRRMSIRLNSVEIMKKFSSLALVIKLYAFGIGCMAVPCMSFASRTSTIIDQRTLAWQVWRSLQMAHWWQRAVWTR